MSKDPLLKLQKNFNTFGQYRQFVKLQEKIAELNLAIARMVNKNPKYIPEKIQEKWVDNFKEELIDAYIMISQNLLNMFNFNIEKMDNEIDFRIDKDKVINNLNNLLEHVINKNQTNDSNY